MAGVYRAKHRSRGRKCPRNSLTEFSSAHTREGSHEVGKELLTDLEQSPGTLRSPHREVRLIQRPTSQCVDILLNTQGIL